MTDQPETFELDATGADALSSEEFLAVLQNLLNNRPEPEVVTAPDDALVASIVSLRILDEAARGAAAVLDAILHAKVADAAAEAVETIMALNGRIVAQARDVLHVASANLAKYTAENNLSVDYSNLLELTDEQSEQSAAALDQIYSAYSKRFGTTGVSLRFAGDPVAATGLPEAIFNREVYEQHGALTLHPTASPFGVGDLLA